jgi:membrane fusion protein (multidrug efflux system)
MVIMLKPILSRLPSLVILMLFIILIAYLQWPGPANNQAKQQQITNVRTAKVSLAEFKDEVEAIGTTRANEQMLVTTKYSDVVQKISFQDGQKVKKGDILVQLDKQEEIAKVREQEANLAEAVVQLNRLQDLLAKRAASKSQVDQQEAKTKAIDAQLMSAHIKLNDTTIKAPFDGVLGFRQISVGAFLAPGDVITSLDDLSRVKVDFTVPERFLTTIVTGQDINATSTAYDKTTFQGKITSIAPRIDPITRTIKVRAEIANDEYQLRPGMLLKIKIVRQIDSVLQIPESAVLPIEDKHFVFVVEEDKAIRRVIQIGRRQPGIVEIISGLKQSEQVVVEGTLKLRDASPIKVLEN